MNERVAHVDGIKAELAHTRSVLEERNRENSDMLATIASLKTQNEKSVEFFNQRLKDLSAVHDAMKEAFSSVSKDALLKNAEMINLSFKQSLEHFFKATEKDRAMVSDQFVAIMKPLKETLVEVDKKVQDLETKRQGAYEGLKEQIDGLLNSQTLLQKEAHNLSRAFVSPTIRGRWGEMQLKRVVELSGLSSHCDFMEQAHIADDEASLRPDMIVTLPKNKKIIIDAKAPLEIFDTDNDDQIFSKEKERGQELAVSLRRHLLALKKKSYHSMLGWSPEFVVMFLPSEAFLHWALTADPTLIDFAAQNEIIIATPITLVALLKAIAFGFKQESVANNIEEVRHLSQQLIDRIHKVAQHFEKLGKNLKQATDAYNQTLASLDTRVLVTARKLVEMKSMTQVSETELPSSLPQVESSLREVKFSERDTEVIS